jgi:hypothetical protein
MGLLVSRSLNWKQLKVLLLFILPLLPATLVTLLTALVFRFSLYLFSALYLIVFYVLYQNLYLKPFSISILYAR